MRQARALKFREIVVDKKWPSCRRFRRGKAGQVIDHPVVVIPAAAEQEAGILDHNSPVIELDDRLARRHRKAYILLELGGGVRHVVDVNLVAPCEDVPRAVSGEHETILEASCSDSRRAAVSLTLRKH